ncbi:MFS transporter [Cellulomonas shaoxiangyii]|uniref:MFS transporter n=1 Tax=Cellulomonas shaoxiangyii TaxID=2566013 RepID=A0A4P7SFA9_9CELL|nr:MFS transporter [Cellulomonas shaoxiangyii]QCB92672.1 MFS transporter [Cellulomonas shaoxiangyii]TGY83431.1 MFS transporter [Cellulomonas shaoxiangyii]
MTDRQNPSGRSPSPVAPRPAVSAPSPFRSRSFLLLLVAQLLGGSGMWMLRMAADWLVLDLTGSSEAVGVLVALQFLPLLLVGPWGGVLADRHDKRRLVELAQGAQALLAVSLAALTFTGAIAVWHLYVAAALMGLVSAVDQPARQVLVGETVGDAHLQPAVSAMNALNQAGGMIGPAVAGLVIHQWGEGWAFTTNAVVAVCVVSLVLTMRTRDLHLTPRVPPSKGQVREGVRYVRERPRLSWVIVLAGLMGALGMNGPVVLTAFAQDVWDTGPAGFGLYNSVSAVGAFVGVVVAARYVRVRARSVVVASGAFAVTEVVAALAPSPAAFLVMLALVGAATLVFLTTAATLVQLTAEPSVRGRVLALYTPLLLGGHACGGLLQGWLTEELGVRTGLVVTGAFALAATTCVAIALARVRRDGASWSSSSGPARTAPVGSVTPDPRRSAGRCRAAPRATDPRGGIPDA